VFGDAVEHYATVDGVLPALNPAERFEAVECRRRRLRGDAQVSCEVGAGEFAEFVDMHGDSELVDGDLKRVNSLEQDAMHRLVGAKQCVRKAVGPAGIVAMPQVLQEFREFFCDGLASSDDIRQTIHCCLS